MLELRKYNVCLKDGEETLVDILDRFACGFRAVPQ